MLLKPGAMGKGKEARGGSFSFSALPLTSYISFLCASVSPPTIRSWVWIYIPFFYL